MVFPVFLLVLVVAPGVLHGAPKTEQNKPAPGPEDEIVESSNYPECKTYRMPSNGLFKSPNYPFDYPNNVMCPMKFEAREGNHIELVFESFNVEDSTDCQYDSLTVYDGPSATSPQIGKYCGTSVPGPVKSKGRYLYVSFSTDFSQRKRGFIGRYKEVQDGCDMSYTDAMGMFKSPNYPKNYDNNEDCMMTFKAKEGEMIELYMDDFDLEFQSDCGYDYVTIYDGKDKNAKKMGTFCGTTIPKQVRSSGQFLFMHFHSDFTVTKKGFMGKYKSVSKGCDLSYTDGNGMFKSPNYPKNYNNNLDCTMFFKANDGEVIEITREDFDLEYQSDCAYDYVTVYDGKDKNAPKMGTFCGANIPPKTVRSSGQFLFMIFHTDDSVTKKGFLGKYQSVKKVIKPQPACGRTVDDKISKIVGGSDTIIQKHPWQVYLEMTFPDATSDCGGSIIARNWVLTAAHCTADVAGESNIKVFAGITNTNIKDKMYTVKRLINHPGYRRSWLGAALNDIALIEINGEFDLTKDTTRAVCLASASDSTTFDGKKCMATGWGRTSEKGPTSTILQEAAATVASRSDCTRVGNNAGIGDIDLVVESHMCAGYLPGGIGVCMGDSGGPLVYKRPDGTHIQAGIVSFGAGCAKKDTYGYYTRVSHYAKWISDNMK